MPNGTKKRKAPKAPSEIDVETKDDLDAMNHHLLGGAATPKSIGSSYGGLLGSGPGTPSVPGISPKASFLRHAPSVGTMRSAGSEYGASASQRPSWIHQHEAYSIMAAHLHKVARSKNWFSEDANVISAVALRLSRGQFAMCPPAEPRLEPFFQALTLLNPAVAMLVTSQVVKALTSRLAPGTLQVPLTASAHVQVVESMQDLAGARKAQGAAFIREEQSLVVWCDHVDRLEANAQALEDKMIAFVWKSATADKVGASVAHGDEDEQLSRWNYEQASQCGHGSVTGWVPTADAPAAEVFNEKGDPELQEAQCEERTTNLQAPLFHGLAYCLNMCLLALMLRTLVQESLIDGQWLRMAIFAAAPFLSLIMLFFCDNIIGVFGLILAPIRHMSRNSRYYSGKAPKRILSDLPHITVQMPVYKESLDKVLIPTIESVKKAISTYELQGGTASIIISEDGMNVVSDEERALRREYYEMNQIGWVARPAHNHDGYIRKGRFKKASNLNFTCRLSLEVERAMDRQRPTGEAAEFWNDASETDLYAACLEWALFSLHPSAEATGNIRFGDLVLLIDSDTRVPEDCFLDAASEMAQCPDVGVLQHCSGVMLVSSSYFELGIAFFTRLVNFAISVTVSAGDVAPFMGHNAFLRWKALQEASFVDPEDGVTKVWSESHVSEDFDMALRLIIKGYITRWATYSKNEFEEGVSLTCDDEINRWQKYAFGCSEMVFNPIWKWYKGPFTPLMRTFLWSSEPPLHYKFSAISYIASYWAIAFAIPMSIGLFLLQGWYAPVLDGAFFSPFQIWIGVVLIFIILGNVSTIIGRYRAKQDSIIHAAYEHAIWVPFMLVFFGGMAYHVLLALIAHITGYNMTWGATVKDLDDSNFFIEVPAILKRFWKMFICCFAVLGGVVVMALDVLPLEWRIQDFFVWWPPVLLVSLHILYPIVLNPALLRFSF